jgi:hypothetical protein
MAAAILIGACQCRGVLIREPEGQVICGIAGKRRMDLALLRLLLELGFWFMTGGLRATDQ